MDTKNILVISDEGNQNYWIMVSSEISKKIGPVSLLLDKEITGETLDHPLEVIIVDISNVDDLHTMISRIHKELPDGRIIAVSSTPTWKQTREILRMGASNLIRKSSDVDELIEELQKL